ncbi:ComEC/Rec2 family competence protein [Sphingomonas baiyangensis]|uniref:ComEC/Rec2 family competence protein n=1 Tax=Sphingomonas baiyangensis TaxID=2572576 RepID=A0A4U1L2A4_9SPHN|nr:ComEC/Rec2 family competence protein [Sphingomonas baiyangensis]TKD50125.1 ComEC/Rec2 family competence protein [Sphingomonas baiyangensis]
MASRALQIGAWGGIARDRLETWLEAERDQLPLWLPVMLGLGITAWMLLPDAARWAGFILAALALGLAGLAAGQGGRASRVMLVAMLAMAAGCALIWWRAERVAQPVLARPAVVAFEGVVRGVEPMPARDLVRLRVAVRDAAGAGLPPLVRLNVDDALMPAGVASGAVVAVRARLMPPAPPAVPGAYDFARVAWFDGLGATGRAFAIEVVRAAPTAGDGMRARLTRHIQAQVPGSAGGVAAALVTGDRGAISEEDDEAMRRSGLAHLLSVSGLHVTAVVGATMLVVLKLLALSPMLALRLRLPLVAAGAAAVTAVFYTWLSGAQVPTIRSCIAALLVLGALALGREAITLRLVAAGATAVLLLWPEALASPSFQLSFAAVTSIVALHEHSRVKRWFMKRDEGWGRRLARGGASLLLTGLVVEFALMPIGLYHFHKAGLYGAAANIVAIPLTTFVVMPLEVLALSLDVAGLGAPAWWLAERTLWLLLWIAQTTADAPGAVKALPSMPASAYALMIGGGLWLALWRTRLRWAGAVPAMAGAIWAAMTPAPDLIVTGDGRHLAIRTADGGMAVLRERAGDYVRSMLGETGGIDGELGTIDDMAEARCTRDACMAKLARDGRRWTIAATRSGYMLPIEEMVALCRASDVIVSERRLPRTCTPRWLKLDRPMLRETGGVALALGSGTVRTVRSGGAHPWRDPPTVQPPRRAWPRRRE